MTGSASRSRGQTRPSFASVANAAVFVAANATTVARRILVARMSALAPRASMQNIDRFLGLLASFVQVIAQVIGKPVERRHEMTALADFETDRSQTDTKRHTAAKLVADLMLSAAELENLLKEELERSPVKDPNDVAFPLAARSLQSRLANIMATVRSLTKLPAHQFEAAHR